MSIPHLVLLGAAALAVVVASLVWSLVSWRRSRRQAGQFAERLRECELDRERLQVMVDRGQRDLMGVNTQLTIYETERVTLQQELLKQQATASESRKELAKANDQSAAFQRKARELTDRLNQAATVRTELQAAHQHHEETKKALSTARLQLEKLRRDASELTTQLQAERTRVASQDKQLFVVKAELQKLRDELTARSAKQRDLETRLAVIGELESERAALRDRNSDLERKLTTVMQVASTVDAVELDREELQVRLETAAYSVRIARNEADRYRSRTETLEAELNRLRSEHKSLEATALQQQGLVAENRKLSYERAEQQKELLAAQTRLNEVQEQLARETRAADEASVELERLRQTAEDTQLEHRTLQAQVQALRQYATQNDQLRAEVATLSQSNQERYQIEAELENVRADLRRVQSALQAAQASAQEVERLRQVAQLYREEQQAHVEAERRLLSVQTELQTLKGGIAANHGKRMEAEQLEHLREENVKLKDEVRQLRVHEKSTEELEKLTSEHKRLRLESELLTQRVAALSAEKQEVTELKRQWEEQSQAVNEALELRDKQGLLEAQLFALGEIPQTRQLPRHSLPVEIGSKSYDIETGLAPLLNSANLRSIVLADVQGFPVVAAGESLAHEGLAAFSAVAQDAAAKARRLLPVADVLMLHLDDSNHLTLSCRLFSLGREAFSIVTIGKDPLELAKSEAVVETLRATMTRSR